MSSGNSQDEISHATYTARSFPLASGEPADPREARIDAALASLNLPVTGGNPHVANRDLSLEGAGTGGAGAGFVRPEDLREQMEHKRDPAIDDATYVARSQYIGNSPNQDASTGNSSMAGVAGRPHIHHTATSPHIPGEFPVEVDEDVSSSATATQRAVGMTPVGGGASAVSDVGASATAPDARAAPDLSGHGGSSTPIVTTTNTVEHAEPVTQNKAASIAKPATAAGLIGAGELGAYEATKDKSIAGGSPLADTLQSTTDGSNDVPSQKSGSFVEGLTPAQSRSVVGAPSSTITQSSSDVQPTPTQRQDLHYGTAAASAGGLGAAGLAAHELNQNNANDTGPASKTIGPHESNIANVLDPRVKPDPELQKQSAAVGSYQSDPNNGPGTRGVPDSQGVTDENDVATASESHLGRNAAITGGIGAAGVGAYELSESQDNDTGPARGTIGPHKSNIANILDPRVKPDIEKQRQAAIQRSNEPTISNETAATDPSRHSESHLGRDTAIGAGAGAAGIVAYDAAKSNIKATGPASKTIGPHESNIANVLDPRVKPDPELQGRDATAGAAGAGTSGATNQYAAPNLSGAEPNAEASHPNRDAAVVAGSSAAAAGVYGATQTEKLDSGPASKTIGPHESNIANILDPRVKPEPALMKQKEPESSLASQRDSSHQQQSLRDAAMIGGAGAAGGAAYDNLREEPLTEKYADPSGQKEGHGLFNRHQAQDSSKTSRDKNAAERGHERSSFERHADREEFRRYEASSAVQSRDDSLDDHHHNKVSIDERGHHKLHKKAVDQSPRTSVDRHDRHLQEARSEEAERGGDRGEVKHGLLHKILHPREHKREKQEAEAHRHQAALDHPIVDPHQVPRAE